MVSFLSRSLPPLPLPFCFIVIAEYGGPRSLFDPLMKGCIPWTPCLSPSPPHLCLSAVLPVSCNFCARPGCTHAMTTGSQVPHGYPTQPVCPCLPQEGSRSQEGDVPCPHTSHSQAGTKSHEFYILNSKMLPVGLHCSNALHFFLR